MGKHLEAPMGMAKVERETARAVSMAAVRVLFVLIFMVIFLRKNVYAIVQDDTSITAIIRRRC